MGLFGKKKEDDAGLDVISEIKEPFSFANFFEEHVVERYKKIKTFLDEKGILFFLLSPFQQRNRLIVELIVIVFGVLVGVVPRSMNLIQEAKERNAASEMAALIEKNTQFTVESILVRPLASSHYEKQHLLAFYIDSANGSSVPSKADRYQVELSPARGVTDAENVQYSYEVLPVSENGRLLLVYTDHRKQNDMTGIYNLTIQAAADDIPVERQSPMEIVLSNTQETNSLFGKNGINLASLTDGVLNDDNTPIAEAEEAFEQALSDYELEVERIASLPLDLTPQPSVDSLRTFCKENRIYPTLTDASTTENIMGITEVSSEETSMLLEYRAGITMGSVLYQNTDDTSNTDTTETETGTSSPIESIMGTDVPVDAPPAAGVPAEGTPTDTPTDTSPADGQQLPAEGSTPDTPEGTPAEGETGTLGTEQVEASPEDVETVHQELEALQGKLDSVLHALTDLNNAAQMKYQVLKGYKLVLNQELSVTTFSEKRTVNAVAK